MADNNQQNGFQIHGIKRISVSNVNKFREAQTGGVVSGKTVSQWLGLLFKVSG